MEIRGIRVSSNDDAARLIQPEIQRLLGELITGLTIVPSKNNPKFAEEFASVVPLTDKELEKIGLEKKDRARRELALKAAEKLYATKEKELGTDLIRQVEREVYLQVLYTLWMQHLENMQHLREGIHWRSVGQRDPLVEYRAESQKLFESLQVTLREEVLRAIYHVRKTDAITRTAQDEEHDTELTKLAEKSVEHGVNEITGGEENRDRDFSDSIKKAKTTTELNHQRNVARKKKKAQRQNRKKSR